MKDEKLPSSTCMVAIRPSYEMVQAIGISTGWGLQHQGKLDFASKGTFDALKLLSFAGRIYRIPLILGVFSCSSPKRCTCIFFGGGKIARLVSYQKPSHKAEALQMWKSQLYRVLSTRTNMKINPKQLVFSSFETLRPGTLYGPKN